MRTHCTKIAKLNNGRGHSDQLYPISQINSIILLREVYLLTLRVLFQLEWGTCQGILFRLGESPVLRKEACLQKVFDLYVFNFVSRGENSEHQFRNVA